MRIRPYTASDYQFVLNSFMKSFVVPRLKTIGHAPPICRIDGKYISEWWHDWMDAVLSRGDSLIACDDVDSVFILGYMARVGDELCYLYTRELYRRSGVAKKLLSQAGFDPKNCEHRVVTRAFQEAFLA